MTDLDVDLAEYTLVALMGLMLLPWVSVYLLGLYTNWREGQP